jgi:hypothetical protein
MCMYRFHVQPAWSSEARTVNVSIVDWWSVGQWKTGYKLYKVRLQNAAKSSATKHGTGVGYI